eukprot:NODE_8297_length_390_cov_114.600000.p5 GENE.NODE_8297_length_390_cov_114.600000~~NODE_8297_length_390_cov_114.600000.p5  ORF type:complete len:57 (-),score=6.83 NODE_8297_length_390_cov_114.600000:116-286(-)
MLFAGLCARLPPSPFAPDPAEGGLLAHFSWVNHVRRHCMAMLHNLESSSRERCHPG